MTYRCPPLNSVKLCFHTPPRLTLTSSPSDISFPSGACNRHVLPGNKSPKIAAKSLSYQCYTSQFDMQITHNLLIHLAPCPFKCFQLITIQWFDRIFNHPFVILHCLHHGLQGCFFLFHAVVTKWINHLIPSICLTSLTCQSCSWHGHWSFYALNRALYGVAERSFWSLSYSLKRNRMMNRADQRI